MFKRGCVVLLLLPALACGGNSTPTAPTPTVTSVTVTGNPVTNGFQCVATATFSNGTTQVVTNQATWTSSDTSIGVVNSSGLVSGVGKDGTVEIRATYQNVSGSISLGVTVVQPAPPPPTTFTLSGVVRDATDNGVLSSVTVMVLDGPNANRLTTTNATGAYSLGSLQLSGFTVRFSKTGYNNADRGVTLTQNTTLNLTLTRTTAGAGGTPPSVWTGALPPLRR